MRIIRMMAVHDEADILQRNLDWYADAGFPTVIVDNESTDGSYEICQAAYDAGTVVALERIRTRGHELRRLLAALQELAAAQQPEYLFLTAPDEFFEVADGGDLRMAMEQDFAAGYNVLRFRNMEFVMTKRDAQQEPDPLRRMRHYSNVGGPLDRAYQFVPRLDIVSGLSHQPTFPDGVEARVAPRRYISRHYPLRSVEQALSKIKRFRPSPEHPRAHVHYLRFSGDPAEFFHSPSAANFYAGDHRWKYHQRLAPDRLTQTTRALARCYLESVRLQERYEELMRRYTAISGESTPPAREASTGQPGTPSPHGGTPAVPGSSQGRPGEAATRDR